MEFARGELQQTQRSLHEAAVSGRHAEREVVWTRWTVRIGCIELRAQHFIENALHSRTPRLKIGNDDGDATLWIIQCLRKRPLCCRAQLALSVSRAHAARCLRRSLVPQAPHVHIADRKRTRLNSRH